MGNIANPLDAHVARHPRGSGIQRLLQCTAEGDRAEIFVIIVSRLPLLSFVIPGKRRIFNHRNGRKLLAAIGPGHERSKVNKRLKHRSGLPLRLEHAVKLRFLIAAPTDHRLDLARLRADDDDRAF